MGESIECRSNSLTAAPMVSGSILGGVVYKQNCIVNK